MKKYAYPNNDGGLWCSETHENDIEENGSCENCPKKEECEK